MTDFDKNFEKYLNLYLDGRLDEAEAEAFEKYLQGNPDKAGELEAYKTLDYTAKGEKLPDLPEGYWEGLNSRINSRIAGIDLEKSGWRKFRAFMRGELFSFHKGMKYAAAVVSIALVVLISRNIMDQSSPTEFAKDKMMEERIEESELSVDSADQPIFIDLAQLPPPDFEPEVEEAMDMPVEAAKVETFADDTDKKGIISEEKPTPAVEQTATEIMSSKIEEPKTITAEPVEDSSLKEVQIIKGGFDAEYGNIKSGLGAKPEGTDEIRLDDMQIPAPAEENKLTSESVDMQPKVSPTSIPIGKSDEIHLSSVDEIVLDTQRMTEKKAVHDSDAVLREDIIISKKLDRDSYDDILVPVPLGDDTATESSGPPEYKPLAELQSIQLGYAGEDTSGIRLPDTLVAKMSDTGQYRYGEEELDATLYHPEAVRAKKLPSDLTLDDFPQLSRVKYGFIEKIAKSDGGGITAMADQPESEIIDSLESLTNLREEGDRLLVQYERTLVPEIKAQLFLDIIDQYFQVAKLSRDIRDIDKCQKLLRLASQMGLMDFREFEAYTDSLNMIQGRK